MNWLPWGKKQASKSEGTAVLGLSDELGRFLMFGENNGATPASSIALYNDSSAVSIPINMIGDAFASIIPVVQQDGKIITDHPVLALLNNPSPFFTRVLMQEMMAKEFLITGETGVVALGTVSRPPLEIQPVSATDFTPIKSTFGSPEAWELTGDTIRGSFRLKLERKNARYLNGTLREFKQIRSYSTRNGSLLRGQSLLVSAAKEVRQHILGNTHNISLLEKGGRVSLVFHFAEDLMPSEFEVIKERVRSQYGGANNAGEIGVTSGGKLDIKEVGVNNKDMDFVNNQVMVKQAVALQCRVPLPLITTEASTFNNYSEAKLALFDDAVLPLADRIFGGLTDLLMPRYGEDPATTKITYDMDQITALAMRRNEELKLRKDLGIESDNEMREMIGREPYKGGDIIYKPAALIPVGTDLFTADQKPRVSLARDEE